MMKSKYLLAIFASVILAFLVSAATFSVAPSSIIFTQEDATQTFIITNSNSSNALSVNIPTLSITGESSYIATFSVPESKTGITTPRTFTLTPTVPIDFTKFKLGKDYSSNLAITNAANSADIINVPVKIVKSYCTLGEVGGNLTLESVDITNDGSGDEDSWNLLDKLTIKVKVTNNNADSSDKIGTIVKVGLYSSTGSEKLSLDSVDLGKISGDGGDKTATFTFNVPADLKDETYFLYVKAYRDGKEKEICTSTSSDLSDNYFKKVSIVRESDENKLVAFDNIVLEPSTATCGEDVTLRATVVNIGDSDQDKVKSSIYSKDLGIDYYKVLDSLDMGDSVDIELSFKVPTNLTDKTYRIELRNRYDFNDDHNADEDVAYDSYSDIFSTNLIVSGCVKPVTNSATIAASLQTADIKAGKDVVIKATVKNTGSAAASYVMSLDGAESFSTVKSLTPSTLTLAAGQSQDVTITLNINKGISGDQVFSIKALSGTNEVKQSVSLTVPEATNPLSGLFSSFGNNWFIWVIVLINVILIVAIIIVAIRVSRN